MVSTTADGVANPAPDRNRALEPVLITESVAIPMGRRVAATAGRTRGRRPRDAATIDTVVMTGTSTLVVREGAAEDKARLMRGERVGEGAGADHEFVAGITFTANDPANVASVLAMAPRGAIFDAAAFSRMNRLVAARKSHEPLDLPYPVRPRPTKALRAR